MHGDFGRDQGRDLNITSSPPGDCHGTGDDECDKCNSNTPGHGTSPYVSLVLGICFLGVLCAGEAVLPALVSGLSQVESSAGTLRSVSAITLRTESAEVGEMLKVLKPVRSNTGRRDGYEAISPQIETSVARPISAARSTMKRSRYRNSLLA